MDGPELFLQQNPSDKRHTENLASYWPSVTIDRNLDIDKISSPQTIIYGS